MAEFLSELEESLRKYGKESITTNEMIKVCIRFRMSLNKFNDNEYVPSITFRRVLCFVISLSNFPTKD